MTYLTVAKQAVLGLVLAAGACAARAQDVEVGPATYTVTLHHADLHPQTPRAVRTLLNRLDDAALAACGASSASLREVKVAVAASACWRDAMDAVVVRIADPAVSAAYVAWYPQPRGARLRGR